MDARSNEAARHTWENKAVGSERALGARSGSPAYFDAIRSYRYGYETPWIPRMFDFPSLRGKRVLEVGVGNGVDGVEMVKYGAVYSGVDITENHLRLAALNFEQHGLRAIFYKGDITQIDVGGPYDIIYSFGVLHHIAHEEDVLRRLRNMICPDGRLMIAVYGRFSFFNFYLWCTHKLRARSTSLDDWRSHVAEHSPLGAPVTIKIRSRRDVEAVLCRAGWAIERYRKRGFVQNYVPVLGRLVSPDGATLNALGRLLGWYHIFWCRPAGSPGSVF
jgi:SAM-dependent methyltransferase